MATIAADLPPNYLTSENTVRSWLLTRDHKRIALLFFASITFFFFVGGIAATLIRIHLVDPVRPVPAEHLQPAVHDARHRHGVVLSDPLDPGHLR